MAESSAYTAGGPDGIRKLNRQITQRSNKFRAANGYMSQGPKGTFKKGRNGKRI